MVPHFQRELERLNGRVMEMGGRVAASIRRAMRAYVEHDPAQAQAVVAGDEEIDAREVLLEEECLKMLALYQPVARDLRYLCAVLKVNNDLERMADHAASIAREVLRPGGPAPGRTSDGLVGEMEEVGRMLQEALQAFISCDASLARRVLAEEPQVDRGYQKVLEESLARMKASPEEVPGPYREIAAAGNLERIGDLIRNIAEDVIYLVEGKIVRHHREGEVRAGRHAGVSPVHLDAILESDPLDESFDH